MQKHTKLKISAFIFYFILALLLLNIPYAKVLRLKDQTFDQVCLMDDIFFDSVRPLKFIVVFYPCILILESFAIKKPYSKITKGLLYLQFLVAAFSLITYTFFMVFIFGKTVDGFFVIVAIQMIFLIFGVLMLFENSFVSNFLLVTKNHDHKA